MGCVKMNGGSMENENRGITTMLLKNAADGALTESGTEHNKYMIKFVTSFLIIKTNMT